MTNQNQTDTEKISTNMMITLMISEMFFEISDCWLILPFFCLYVSDFSFQINQYAFHMTTVPSSSSIQNQFTTPIKRSRTLSILENLQTHPDSYQSDHSKKLSSAQSHKANNQKNIDQSLASQALQLHTPKTENCRQHYTKGKIFGKSQCVQTENKKKKLFDRVLVSIQQEGTQDKKRLRNRRYSQNICIDGPELNERQNWKLCEFLKHKQTENKRFYDEICSPKVKKQETIPTQTLEFKSAHQKPKKGSSPINQNRYAHMALIFSVIILLLKMI